KQTTKKSGRHLTLTEGDAFTSCVDALRKIHRPLKEHSMKLLSGLGFMVFAIIGLAGFGRNNSLVRFNGAIRGHPASNLTVNGTTTTVTPNTVRGIAPAGQIWRISTLTANVTNDGRIRVFGRGLLLGGGNAIGSNGGQSVFATLFCSGITSNTNEAGVALD